MEKYIGDGQKLWLLVARFVRQVSVQREAIGATDDNEIRVCKLYLFLVFLCLYVCHVFVVLRE